MADNASDNAVRVLVRLTPDQRERVKKKTGWDLDVLEFRDENGTLTRRMPNMTPIEVEKLAYRRAGLLDDQAEIDKLKAESAEQEAKAEEEGNAKGAALAAQLEADALANAEAIEAAFAVEGMAAEAAREVAKEAYAAVNKKARKKK